MYREGIYTGHRHDTTTVAIPASNNVVTDFGPVPEGYAWYLENIGFGIFGGTHTGGADIGIVPDNPGIPTLGTWDHAGFVTRLILFNGSAANAIGANFAQPIYVPSNHFVVVVLAPFGGTLSSGDSVIVTAQFSTHQLNPAHMMSPEDRFQAARSHEHKGGPEALAATGPRAV